MNWTDDVIADLTRMWEVEGLTASVIGRHFGVTRSTILGKVHRLGLAARVVGRKPAPQWAWNKERTEALIRMWNEGMPIPKIADALGTTTRAAVRKRQRLDLPQRQTVKPVVSQIRPPSFPKTIDPSEVGRVRFSGLTPFSCRWIPGNPDGVNTLYCGDACVPGKSYCERHRAIMYTPLPKPTGKPFSLPGRRAA